jgi:hypothetical protein
MLGILVLLGWNLLGHVGLARLARRAAAITDPDWLTVLGTAAARSGIRQPVRLALSREVGTPITWGTLFPIVLLPADSTEWTTERRRVVLLHELAHIARMDYLTQLVAHIVCALYWAHPLVWLAAKRLRHEGERACDDRVLADGIPAADYAAQLLNVARGARGLRPSGAVAIGMARHSALEGRMLAVLDDRQDRHPVSRRTRIAALALFTVALVPLACVRPIAAAEATPAKGPLGATPETYATPDSVIERTVAAPAQGTLRLDIESGGGVTIAGWDQPSVRVRARLAGRDWRDQTFSMESGRGDVVVRLRFAWSRGAATTSTSNAFEINVPRTFDVHIASGGGAVSIADVNGNFSGHTGGGDLTLRRVTGDSHLSTGGGDIVVTDAQLDGTVRTGGGLVQLSRVRGSLKGLSGSGPVLYAESRNSRGEKGSLDAYTVDKSGKTIRYDGSSLPRNLRIETGALHAEKAGGDISIDEAPDGGVVHTGGGRIRIARAGGDLDVSTGGGDIVVGPTNGSIRAGTGAGAVDLTVIGSREETRNVDVTSGTGRVTITLPASYSGAVELETAFTHSFGREARIISEWSLERDPITGWDDTQGTPRRFVRARATFGSGRGLVRVKTVNGDVEIRRGRE